MAPGESRDKGRAHTDASTEDARLRQGCSSARQSQCRPSLRGSRRSRRGPWAPVATRAERRPAWQGLGVGRFEGAQVKRLSDRPAKFRANLGRGRGRREAL